ncbi:MAG: type IVB secretion system protein IcmH/DotU [Pseudomonadota bacterium]
MTSDPLKGEPRIVLPTPGKKRAPEPEAPPPEPATPPQPTVAQPILLPVDEMVEEFRMQGADIPLLVAEAAPLLNLGHTLKTMRTPPEVAALKSDVTAALRTYEQKLARAGIVPEQARAAHYCVCATLDDIARNSEWGAEWGGGGLVAAFHMDVTGGDKVFELLAHFQRNAGANRDILLLIYLCLALGFEGRTRVSPRGSLELAQIRDGLYRTLRMQLGTFERELSPNWQGLDARHKPVRPARLLWGIVGGLILTFGLGYIGLTTLLNRASDATIQTMAGLPPGDAPSLFIPAPPPPPEPEPEAPVVEAPTPSPPPAPVEPPGPTPIETFISFLQPEVEEGLVRLYRDGEAVLVRVANSGAFAPGSASLEPEFTDIFDRIGQALVAEDFDITIYGHTDNRGTGGTAFPSNWHLSTARAEAVRDIIIGYIEPSRIDVRGEAELRPIATNETPEGREANRRTEILVKGAGARVSPDLLNSGSALEAAQ